jgi:hypothetical protein
MLQVYHNRSFLVIDFTPSTPLYLHYRGRYPENRFWYSGPGHRPPRSGAQNILLKNALAGASRGIDEVTRSI